MFVVVSTVSTAIVFFLGFFIYALVILPVFVRLRVLISLRPIVDIFGTLVISYYVIIIYVFSCVFMNVVLPELGVLARLI